MSFPGKVTIAVTLDKDILSNDTWWGSLSFYKWKHALLKRNSYKNEMYGCLTWERRAIFLQKKEIFRQI
jgi:hypothetical protein